MTDSKEQSDRGAGGRPPRSLIVLAMCVALATFAGAWLVLQRWGQANQVPSVTMAPAAEPARPELPVSDPASPPVGEPAAAAAAQPAAVDDALTPETVAEIASQLDVARCRVSPLVFRPLADGQLRIDVNLDGAPATLALTPQALRAEDFVVLVDDGSGAPQAVAVPPSETYAGTIAGMAGSKVAASMAGGALHAVIRDGSGRQWGIQPVPAGLAPAGAQLYATYADADVVPGEEACGTGEMLDAAEAGGEGGAGDDGSDGTGETPPTESGAAGQVYQTELAIDADYDFFTRAGGTVSGVVANVEQVINGVNLIYEGDAQIRHVLTAIVVRSTPEASPYTSTDPSTLLGQFRTHWNGYQTGIRRDVAHLMTGRDLDGTWVGWSYVSVICSSSSAYGLSYSTYTLNQQKRIALTAHELGHNWNLSHCTCNIMCATIGGCTGNMVVFSAAELASLIAYRNTRSCLELVGGTAPPADAAAPLISNLSAGGHPAVVTDHQVTGGVSVAVLIADTPSGVNWNGTVITGVDASPVLTVVNAGGTAVVAASAFDSAGHVDGEASSVATRTISGSALTVGQTYTFVVEARDNSTAGNRALANFNVTVADDDEAPPVVSAINVDGRTYDKAALGSGVVMTGMVQDAGSGIYGRNGGTPAPRVTLRKPSGALAVNNVVLTVGPTANAAGLSAPVSIGHTFAASLLNEVGTYTGSVTLCDYDVDRAGDSLSTNVAFSFTVKNFPTVTLKASALSVREEDGTCAITLQKSTAADAVDVTLVTGGTAASGQDYTLETNIVFESGITSKVVSVGLVNDSAAESDESLTVRLGTLNGGRLGAATNVTLTIRDDDVALPAVTDPASVLLAESFCQTAGMRLADDMNWVVISSVSGVDPALVAGSLQHAAVPAVCNRLQLGVNAEGVQRDFVGQTNTFYASMLFSVPAVPTVTTVAQWLEFQGTGASGYRCGRAYFRRLSATTYCISVDMDTQGTKAETGPLNAGEVYQLVFRNDNQPTGNGDAIELWVNPGTTENAPALYHVRMADPATGGAMMRIRLLANNSWRGYATWQVDELRVATKWAGVIFGAGAEASPPAYPASPTGLRVIE